MKVVVVPRDPNPYQESLYRCVRAGGVVVDYLEGPTRSHTLNLLARPLLLLWYRLQGFRVLHVHWVYDFVPQWATRARGGRRVAQWWFGCTLLAARACGLRIVWTAHNVLPHEPVFADDRRARRVLAGRSDTVLVHAPSTGRRVQAMGARNVRVVPQGAYGQVPRGAEARRRAREELGLPDGRVLVNVGIQRPYKGTDALLSALVGIEDPVLVLLGGECPDPGWRHRLETLGAQCGSKARVRLRHLDDAELDRWLSAADVAVFPFREVTNSSSVLRALGAGVPVLVPDLEEFSDLPSDAVFRYEPGVGLGRALRDMIGLPGDQLALRAAAAVRFAEGQTWAAASAATMAAYAAVLRDGAVTPADAAVQRADAVILPIRSSGATVRPTDAAAGTVGESVAVR